MSPIAEDRTQMAAKIESVEGTAETLAAADGFLAFPGTDPDINQEMYKRNPYRETFSPMASIPGKRSGKLPITTELVGSGAAGTAPFWGKLMKACAFAETIVGGVSVAYAPASASIPSLTAAAYMDGVIYKLWGARGSLKLDLEVGKPGLLHFDFQGSDWSVADGAMLVGISYSSIIPPAFLGAVFTIDGIPFFVEKVSFDLATVLVLRPDPNSPSGNKSVRITGRDPKITLDPEMVLCSSIDIWSKWRNGSQMALNCVLGSTPGNIITIGVPKFQITDAKLGKRSGLRTNNLTALMALNAGDDEFTITLT